LPACRREIPNWWLAVQVIVAVTGTGDAVDAADDDVCAQGVAGAEGAVGGVGWTDDLAAVVGDLGRCQGSRCCEEECLDKHVD